MPIISGTCSSSTCSPPWPPFSPLLLVDIVVLAAASAAASGFDSLRIDFCSFLTGEQKTARMKDAATDANFFVGDGAEAAASLGGCRRSCSCWMVASMAASFLQSSWLFWSSSIVFCCAMFLKMLRCASLFLSFSPQFSQPHGLAALWLSAFLRSALFSIFLLTTEKSYVQIKCQSLSMKFRHFFYFQK